MKNIIFDLDGTLIDSMPWILEVLHQNLCTVLKREVTFDEFMGNFSHNPETTNQHFGMDETHQQKMRELLFEKTQTILDFPFFPGMRQWLFDLKDQGHDLFLWTNRDRSSAEKILKHHQVSHLFTDLTTATEKTLKPYQGHWPYKSSLPGPKEAVIIGDSASDLATAQHYDFYALIVGWCSVFHLQKWHATPPLIAKNFNELENAFFGLKGQRANHV